MSATDRIRQWAVAVLAEPQPEYDRKRADAMHYYALGRYQAKRDVARMLLAELDGEHDLRPALARSIDLARAKNDGRGRGTGARVGAEQPAPSPASTKEGA